MLQETIEIIDYGSWLATTSYGPKILNVRLSSQGVYLSRPGLPGFSISSEEFLQLSAYVHTYQQEEEGKS